MCVPVCVCVWGEGVEYSELQYLVLSAMLVRYVDKDGEKRAIENLKKKKKRLIFHPFMYISVDLSAKTRIVEPLVLPLLLLSFSYDSDLA